MTDAEVDELERVTRAAVEAGTQGNSENFYATWEAFDAAAHADAILSLILRLRDAEGRLANADHADEIRALYEGTSNE